MYLGPCLAGEGRNIYGQYAARQLTGAFIMEWQHSTTHTFPQGFLTLKARLWNVGSTSHTGIPLLVEEIFYFHRD